MFGKGHLRDLPDERDYSAAHLLVAGIDLDSVDLSHHIDTIRDQGATSSCVGQAFARAIHIRARILGWDLDFPSALAIYAQARKEPLVDEGCYPRNAAKGLRSWGTCSEHRWPFSVGKVDEPLPFDVLEADIRVDGFYTLQARGAALGAQIRQALSAGYPIPFGQEVDDVFERHEGGVIGPWVGPSNGGHYTCLVGYRNTPGHGVDYLGVNSWGPDWGQSGLYWLSEARLLDPRVTSDFYALSLAGAK